MRVVAGAASRSRRTCSTTWSRSSRATRADQQVQVGASPRGGLALVQLARGQAVLDQRDYVVPEDVKHVGRAALAHRITLRPSCGCGGSPRTTFVARLLGAVPTPAPTRPPLPPRPRRSPANGRSRAAGRGPLAAVAACPPPAHAGARRLLLATLTRRPELVGVAAPALLLFGVALQAASGAPGARGARARRPGRAGQQPAVEGELAAVDLAVDDTRFDTRWLLEAGRGVAEPASATAVNGAAARFEFTVPRWGRRQLGSAALVLHRSLAADGGPGRGRAARPWTVTRSPRWSAPGWCSAGCRTGSASTRRGRLAREPSSPACASTCQATGSARSTGRR